ncbi:fimbria/pilus outer membrane usher protein [Lysobacter koreensis]|uniref:Fimbria/pilus outer membrane usher protein n=1 Tax=Lysobacter koreensis TaxID=266122 RepID=A0ABW2YMJ7_9GAMM
MTYPRRPDPSRLAYALAAVLYAATTTALAAAGLPAGLDDETPTASQRPGGPQALYLDIIMDGQVVRPLVRFGLVDGQLSVDPADLDAIGLILPETALADTPGLVALDAIPGLTWNYNAAMQQVVLTPASALRRANRLGYQAPPPTLVTRDHGLIADWDLYGRHDQDNDSASVGSGLRWFGRFGSIEGNGVTRIGDDSDGYRRLDTRWAYSDPRNMWTWTAGDLISGGLAWTRPVRLGGVQWRRNFSVRPDLIIYPLPQFSADAVVPSSVELYVNNVRQYSGEVDPGPFVLSDFPRVVGAGQAMVVVTDALGRTTQTSVPLYVDYQRLARGLSDFSLEAGLLRRNYGIESNDYFRHPVATGSWRRGLTDDFTAELHAEYGKELSLGGVGFAWSPWGRYGVFNANFAHSSHEASGHQYGGGYQWFGQRMGFDAYRQRATAHFRDVGALEEGSLPLREQDRASLWFTVPRGSLSLTWLRYRDEENPRSRSLGIGFNQSYRRFSWTLSAFDDSRAGTGSSLSISVPLGPDVFSSVSLDHQDHETRAVASVARALPYEGGLGWQAQAKDNGDGQLAAGWRGRGGEIWAGVDRNNGQGGAYVQGGGSLVWMDSSAFVSRRINDSFAVVSTNGVSGVPILYENRVAGRTNDRGYLLLTDLRGWQRNRVAIDPDQLAPNLEVPSIERLVTPADRSGVRVPFAINQTHSAMLELLDANGQPVEAGTRVTRADGSEAVVGFDGALWLEHYAAGESLSWTRAGADCIAVTPALVQAEDRGAPRPLKCRQEARQ